MGPPVLFVATGAALDEEMAARIARHRAGRPPSWATLEVRFDLGPAIAGHEPKPRTVLVDCLTLLVSNILLDGEGTEPAETVEGRVDAEIDGLVAAAAGLEAELVVVSNEVGMGIVPEHPLGRAYRDLLGRANQRMARAADEVYLLVAGVPLTVKGGS
jgi:adenosylcobinamide kinase/adenosylcobinamide-phosphate guanylyltransferase